MSNNGEAFLTFILIFYHPYFAHR